MGSFLVEMKSGSKVKRVTLTFKNDEEAKQWGIKQTEVWRNSSLQKGNESWQNARIVVTPVIAAPPLTENQGSSPNKGAEFSSDVHVRQVEARKQKRLAEKEK